MKHVCHTCRQSRAVLTILGALDWHASSKGRKYRSAAMKLTWVLGRGSAPDAFCWLSLQEEYSVQMLVIGLSGAESSKIKSCGGFGTVRVNGKLEAIYSNSASFPFPKICRIINQNLT